MSAKRVVLAMSGGVDSSVAAHLLVEAGYDVVGLFMRTGVHASEEDQPQRKTRGCCSAIDAADAQRVADRLDIPFYALNFQEDFGRIKDYFADEYARGRTPNPCVVCNTWLKFGKLWDYAEAINADYIATGHYAQVVLGSTDEKEVELHRGADPSKDQSYFLFGIRQDLLRRLLFPIGAMQKSDVREIASRMDLGVHTKPDSQEICFVPTGNYQDFLREHRPEALGVPGRMVDTEGQEVGTHKGLGAYTIGQRKGLGAFGSPRFVVDLDPTENLVVIGVREQLQESALHAERVNWLTPQIPTAPVRCQAKIRYLHPGTAATVTPLEGGRARVELDEPQSAITPGQAVVFYDQSRVLGGGWIE